MKILLIEPDHVLARTYGQALQDAGHEVVIEPTAQAAISAADADQPDLIILELQLVEHSGIEFLYELRSYSDWQAIPVIIQSQVPPAEFTDNWQLLQDELGIQAYLYKPRASLRDLLQAITELAPQPA